MLDKFNRFFSLNINETVEVNDPTNFAQCMDLAYAWCDTLKIPRDAIRHLYAHQVYTQPTATTRKYFDLYKNTLTFIPRVGDLAVFKATSGNVAGHIAVVTDKSTLFHLVTLDQNWDTAHYYHIDPKTKKRVPYTRIVVHRFYSGCIGFLRPKA